MTTALVLFLLASAGGMALLVAGVFTLAGAGWALLAGAACLLMVAAFLRSGMRPDRGARRGGDGG